MVQQLFEALFVVSFVALVAAPVIGVLLVALPGKKIKGTVRTRRVHAHV